MSAPKPRMTVQEFNAAWAKRQRWAYVRVALGLLALVLVVVAGLWAHARPSSWTRCDRGVECSGTGCRCVR